MCLDGQLNSRLGGAIDEMCFPFINPPYDLSCNLMLGNRLDDVTEEVEETRVKEEMVEEEEEAQTSSFCMPVRQRYRQGSEELLTDIEQ